MGSKAINKDELYTDLESRIADRESMKGQFTNEVPFIQRPEGKTYSTSVEACISREKIRAETQRKRMEELLDRHTGVDMRSLETLFRLLSERETFCMQWRQTSEMYKSEDLPISREDALTYLMHVNTHITKLLSSWTTI